MQHEPDNANPLLFPEKKMDPLDRKQLELELNLHEALRMNQFCLHYQPQYHIHNGTLRGFEALLRWEHPLLGMIMPMEFIPLAEETRFIHRIGEWVIENACKTLQSFPSTYDHLIITVNNSVIQLMEEQFPEQVARLIEQAGIPPSRLELEFTQTTLLTSPEMSNKQLNKLQLLGVQLALEDYGHKGLYPEELLLLPFHTIKLCKTFAQSLTHDHLLDNEITRIYRILQPHHTLVVMGIETYEQLVLLKNIPYDLAQGFLLSMPLTKDRLLKLLFLS